MHMRNWLVTTERKQEESYKGIPVQADLELHPQAIALCRKYVPKGSRVLDVGAGPGAFSKRLAVEGYQVAALDRNPDQWVPGDIPFVTLNLDSGMSDSIKEKFDAAVCLEVIEHVENPWKLLRDIYGLLNPGGILVLSTPNVTSFLSRLIFFRKGCFHQFCDEDVSYGHIHPLTDLELSVMAHRVGWRIVEKQPGGYLPVFDLSSLRLKSLIFNLLRGLAYLIAKGWKHGWCLLFVLEKPRS